MGCGSGSNGSSPLADGSTLGVDGSSLPDGSAVGVDGAPSPDGSVVGIDGSSLPDGSAVGVDGSSLPDGSVVGIDGAPPPDGSVVGADSAPLPDGAACDAAAATDVNNCGACGHVCPNVPEALASCQAGQCLYTCAKPFADCNGDLNKTPTDGCEADLTTDPNDCGTCGVVCPSGTNHAVAICRDMGSGPACNFGCTPGYADCNVKMTDGCEANLQTDGKNCGECFDACPSNACNAGSCAGEAPFCDLFGTEIKRAFGPALAGSGSTFALAWIESTDYNLHLGLLDALGKPLGASKILGVVQSGDRFDMAFDGTSFVLAWGHNTTLFGQRFSPVDLSPSGPQVTATMADDIVRMTVAAGHGETLLVPTVGLFTPVSVVVPWTNGGPLGTSHPIGLGGVSSGAAVTDGFALTYGLFDGSGHSTGVGVATVSPAGAVLGSASLLSDSTWQGWVASYVATVGSGAVLSLNATGSSTVTNGVSAMALDSHGNQASSWVTIGPVTLHYTPQVIAVGGGTSQASVLIQTNDKMSAQSLDATASPVGAAVALPRAPTYASGRIATSTAGTLYAWSRDRQVGDLQDNRSPIEAAFITKAGAVTTPCN